MKKSCLGFIAAVITASAPLCQAADSNPTKSVNTNRLAKEKSPYLLQHAHNPVDWFPWGEEAFAKARAEGKPILLSVGYSTCHWCHVMERESFENEEIARLMNEHFVPVKVDREERKDVDRMYMTFVQATTGSGGWPMTVFLTPELKPFLGGTYFPPEDKYGRPGFKTLLTRLNEGWKKDRAGIIAHADEVVKQLAEYATSAAPKGTATKEAITAALNTLTRSFDEEHGGFGDAPKFPRPVTLNLLFRIAAREGAASKDGKAAIGMALATLKKMAAGGMHDQLGGGFHRYSVDRYWHVPHYEKMAYDQAQLASSYLDAFLATGADTYAQTARHTLDYVLREMTHPDGGFYSAEDADSLPTADAKEKTEGAFYVWEKKEIAAALDPDAAAIFNAAFGVEDAGNSPAGSDPHGELKNKNTLIRRATDEELAAKLAKPAPHITASLAASAKTLLALRAKRPHPHLDDKILTSWNGLLISAFARAGAILDEPRYTAAAQRAATFIQKHLTRDGALLRSYRNGPSDIAGFADDYATLIAGLLDLYEADFDTRWIQWAAQLQTKMDTLFWDETGGGYFETTGTDKTVLLRMKEDSDNAEPAASSVAAMNLIRLAQLLGDDTHRQRAEKTIAAFAPQLAQIPSALPQMLCALDALQGKPRQIVIAGKPDAADTRALLRIVRRTFAPGQLVLLADGADGQAWLGKKLPFLATMTPQDGQAAAYVCENFVCKLPLTTPADLEKALTGEK